MKYEIESKTKSLIKPFIKVQIRDNSFFNLMLKKERKKEIFSLKGQMRIFYFSLSFQNRPRVGCWVPPPSLLHPHYEDQ